MCSGHIARGLVVFACQEQNEPEYQAAGRGSHPRGRLQMLLETSPLALPRQLTRFVELQRLPSELLHQRQGLASNLTCRDRKTYPQDTAPMSSTGWPGQYDSHPATRTDPTAPLPLTQSQRQSQASRARRPVSG